MILISKLLKLSKSSFELSVILPLFNTASEQFLYRSYKSPLLDREMESASVCVSSAMAPTGHTSTTLISAPFSYLFLYYSLSIVAIFMLTMTKN